jgi:hypothetical protein
MSRSIINEGVAVGLYGISAILSSYVSLFVLLRNSALTCRCVTKGCVRRINEQQA